MQKRLIAALSLSMLSACTSPYGNYAALPNSTNARMADDTTHELTVLYPPAFTHLHLMQTANDAYGAELVKQLRGSGYALQEGGQAKPAADSDSVPVSYVVTHLSSELNRITLNIGNEALSRVYSVTGQGVVPAGVWTRKE